ncbi:hypothetical protein [Legionella londiniensis]|uniref:Capsule biosynthesis protein CapB n=2 Tax=Legionella londiniensis TaxID=45068 RepID=A0A0W0VPK0_9GAMM|nr:hypothetical protein [Legionella londiniensis]KTD21689.1 Capsule biosynthesis protein CapB [Legionella londiniensis]STX93476.1 poly-gamma-glutamate synthase PgsB [Legionella londiniensis]
MRKEIEAFAYKSANLFLARLDAKFLKPVWKRFLIDEKRKESGFLGESKANTSERLLKFLKVEIQACLDNISRFNDEHQDFINLYQKAYTVFEQQKLILNYAQVLGATKRDLKKDSAAFSRWFDKDAVIERYQRKIAQSEYTLILCLKLIKPLLEQILEHMDKEAFSAFWQQIRLHELFETMLKYRGDARVVQSALFSLRQSLIFLPQSFKNKLFTDKLREEVLKIAHSGLLSLWCQCEALEILLHIDERILVKLLADYFSNENVRDNLFLHARFAVFASLLIGKYPELEKTLQKLCHDKKPYVRQMLARNLKHLPEKNLQKYMRTFCLLDKAPEVRAAGLLNIPELALKEELFTPLLDFLIELSEQEKDTFVLRVLCKTIADSYFILKKNKHTEAADVWLSRLKPCLSALHLQAENLSVRREAAYVLLSLWCESDEKARALKNELIKLIQPLRAGQSIRLPKKLLQNHDTQTIGRVLAVLAINDFDLIFKIGKYGSSVTRGHKFGFRLWRLLYELRHSSSDKRQGFPYTIGRTTKGQIRAPSSILAEVTKTNVPGEPLLMESENGYRPYLPLMDDVMTCLKSSGKTMKLFTSEGVTSIKAPDKLLHRLKAYYLLNMHFNDYDKLRNWQETDSVSPKRYIKSLKRLGFHIFFKPYDTEKADPAVTRFFSSISLVPFLEHWHQFEDYMSYPYGNSLSDLFIFCLIILGYFIGRHTYLNLKVWRARKALPLVIGGTGTRGKSGVERMKAALFNALGYSVICKTTGSEAMLLYSNRLEPLRELHLFRPFDKATIWEQTEVMQMARNLGVEVFLWECMGLHPNYIKILQRDWSQDNLSTITNAYPDHEDIQGPAGINIPRAMAEFIQPGGILITSEQQMLPILREEACLAGSEIVSVNWIEKGLITEDILKRFPYHEHAENLALILKLADRLGIDHDFILKEIPERVVPDIGVLKIFPPAVIDTRKLVFVNGMSANDRYGCLENWKQIGFQNHDPYEHPDEWISTVVNNRGDRVTRSQVFASMIVRDLQADKHFLIGTNLNGLIGFIEGEWHEYAKTITLWPEEEGGTFKSVSQGYLRKMRIPYLNKHIVARLKSLLEGIDQKQDVAPIIKQWESPEKLEEALRNSPYKDWLKDILAYHELNLKNFYRYEEILKKAEKAGQAERGEIDQQFKEYLQAIFMNKIHIIGDYAISANAIMNKFIQETPPGLKNALMGIQNIKGPGLELIRIWQDWEYCHKACRKIKQHDASAIEKGIKELVDFHEYNLLCFKEVEETLEELEKMKLAEEEWHAAEIKRIRTNYEQAKNKLKKHIDQESKTGFFYQIKLGIQSVFNVSRAVQRRRIANQIYKDLANERISVKRAEKELKKLTIEQTTVGH